MDYTRTEWNPWTLSYSHILIPRLVKLNQGIVYSSDSFVMDTDLNPGQ